MERLELCPFCGGPATSEQVEEDNQFTPLWWLVGCDDADCIGMAHSAFERRGDAVKAWNTRSTVAELEHLRAEREGLRKTMRNVADRMRGCIAADNHYMLNNWIVDLEIALDLPATHADEAKGEDHG